MKTAEEWIELLNKRPSPYATLVDEIKAIQSDALMEAHGLAMTRSDQSTEPDCACAADDIYSVVQTLNQKPKSIGCKLYPIK